MSANRDQVFLELIQECWRTAEEKGWHEGDRRFPEEIALMHSELSEALEAFRDGDLFGEVTTVEGKPEGIAAELADLLIRVFETCRGHDIPIAHALTMKLAYNKTRPYRHGGKLA